MISFQASVSKGWLHQYGGFMFDDKYYLDPLYRFFQDKKINEFVRRRFKHYPVYHMEANLMQAAFVDENQVLIGGIQPNLILAIALGAEFVSYPDKDADVRGNPLSDLSRADDLPSMGKILNHPFIVELSSQIARIHNHHPELKVIPPFFWDGSGRATIHGILTTSFKLAGENAMLYILVDPDLLHAIHQWITEAYVTLILHFATLTNFSIKSVHVGECSGTMVSDDQYLEFITPYVSQLGKRFGNIRLHSCGQSDHILNAISQIDHLSVIDTGSNTSIAGIRERMGVDFEINVEPPLKLMLKDSPDRDLLSWLNQALEENQGGFLKLVLHIEPDYSTEKCLMIYEELLTRQLIQ